MAAPVTRLVAILLLVAAGCTAGSPDAAPPTTADRRVEQLEAEVARLEAELVKSNVDQQDLRRRIADVYIERASRAAPRPAATAGRGCGRWASLVGRYDWPVATACAVMVCESGGNPNARNPRSSATGLFQILGGPSDPQANVAQAYRMWSSRRWQPWNASKGCWS